MGYYLRYADSTRSLSSHGSYPQALPEARDRAARSGRVVVICNDWDGRPYAIVGPDGSVSGPASG